MFIESKVAVILESEEKIDVLKYEMGKENVKLYVEALGIWVCFLLEYINPFIIYLPVYMITINYNFCKDG